MTEKENRADNQPVDETPDGEVVPHKRVALVMNNHAFVGSSAVGAKCQRAETTNVQYGECRQLIDAPIHKNVPKP